MKRHKIFPDIKQYIAGLEEDFDAITQERKSSLIELSDYITEAYKDHGYVRLTFICTHNSRRSHIAQIWAHTFAMYYEMDDLSVYSGGTEGTAFHPNAIFTLKKTGFRISDDGSKNNPRYRIQAGDKLPDLICFSKTLTEPPNPESNFAAIMVCSDADENCPIVHGADIRISMPYDDPRHFDGKPEQNFAYAERCKEIGRDLLWCFNRVHEKS